MRVSPTPATIRELADFSEALSSTHWPRMALCPGPRACPLQGGPAVQRSREEHAAPLRAGALRGLEVLCPL